MIQVPCSNPAHGVKFHVPGSSAAAECAAAAFGPKRAVPPVPPPVSTAAGTGVPDRVLGARDARVRDLKVGDRFCEYGSLSDGYHTVTALGDGDDIGVTSADGDYDNTELDGDEIVSVMWRFSTKDADAVVAGESRTVNTASADDGTEASVTLNSTGTRGNPYADVDSPVGASLLLPDGTRVIAADFGARATFTLADGTSHESWVHPCDDDLNPLESRLTLQQFQMLEAADEVAGRIGNPDSWSGNPRTGPAHFIVATGLLDRMHAVAVSP